ncbi:UDP-N-acetylglucosamine 2-epimerase [Thalassospira lucentensis]|uniref:UDP-N-acetylglucosamine 2-epimerase n=1 Tax=Thalassospira lucentensis TaxID=168935 RepID=UPI0004017EF9|nr:UDP-N-acetylglucosamine 2-epimerase [Thalassospira lucentensis]
MQRKICFILTTRGNYGKTRSILLALKQKTNVELQVVLGGELLNAEYGGVGQQIIDDGFSIAGTLDYIVGQKSLESVALSAAKASMLATELFEKLKPGLVFLVADRYEILAFAQSALCLNIPIAHLEGGEISGSIDERIRHAVSKLSHLHFPANTDAAERLVKMGEAPETIYAFGTPSLDVIREYDLNDSDAVRCYLATHAVGTTPDLKSRFIVVSHHPVVTEYGDAASQYEILVDAVRQVGLPTVWVKPNDDAGAAELDEHLDVLIKSNAFPVIATGGLPLNLYATLLNMAVCLVGNSSSGIREASWLGVPVVNVGTRQFNRKRGANVLDVGFELETLIAAIAEQAEKGKLKPDELYGNGFAGESIANVLVGNLPPLNKTIVY